VSPEAAAAAAAAAEAAAQEAADAAELAKLSPRSQEKLLAQREVAENKRRALREAAAAADRVAAAEARQAAQRAAQAAAVAEAARRAALEREEEEDRRTAAMMDALLAARGIRRDTHMDVAESAKLAEYKRAEAEEREQAKQAAAAAATEQDDAQKKVSANRRRATLNDADAIAAALRKNKSSDGPSLLVRVTPSALAHAASKLKVSPAPQPKKLSPAVTPAAGHSRNQSRTHSRNPSRPHSPQRSAAADPSSTSSSTAAPAAGAGHRKHLSVQMTGNRSSGGANLQQLRGAKGADGSGSGKTKGSATPNTGTASPATEPVASGVRRKSVPHVRGVLPARRGSLSRDEALLLDAYAPADFTAQMASVNALLDKVSSQTNSKHNTPRGSISVGSVGSAISGGGSASAASSASGSAAVLEFPLVVAAHAK
jgi:hypothetical protein